MLPEELGKGVFVKLTGPIWAREPGIREEPKIIELEALSYLKCGNEGFTNGEEIEIFPVVDRKLGKMHYANKAELAKSAELVL